MKLFVSRVLCLAVLLSITASLYARDGERLAALQKEADDIVLQLEKEAATAYARAEESRKRAREWIEFDRAALERLRAAKEPYQPYIKFRELVLSFLDQYKDSGVSDSKLPGREVYDMIHQGAIDAKANMDWGGNGLGQLSELLGIHYYTVEAKNKERLAQIIKQNREYGLHRSRVNALETSIIELARMDARVYPFVGSDEVRGFQTRYLNVLVEIRRVGGGPKPGSEDYRARERELLARWRVMGVDTDKLLAHKAAVLKRIRNLRSTDVGADHWLLPEERTANETEWRVAMSRAVHVKWLDMLESGNATDMQNGLVEIGKTVGKFEQASQLEAESALDDLVSTQKLATQILGQIPVVGQVMNVHAIISGTTLDGEELSKMNRAMGALIALAPASLAQMRKQSPGLNATLNNWGRQLAGKSDAVLKGLGNKLGFSVAQLKKMSAWADSDDAEAIYDFMADLAEGEVRDRL